jgi:hypothetical protein
MDSLRTGGAMRQIIRFAPASAAAPTP